MSLTIHPGQPHLAVLGGQDPYARIFDDRKPTKPVREARARPALTVTLWLGLVLWVLICSDSFGGDWK